MQTMHAIVHRKYGTPDVLRYEEIARPVPGDDDRSVSDCRRVLLPAGAFVSCTGGPSMIRWLSRLAWMLLASRFTSQTLTTYMASPNQKALLALKEIVETKKLKPVIERRYALRDVAEALRHVGEGHAQGQTVITGVDEHGRKRPPLARAGGVFDLDINAECSHVVGHDSSSGCAEWYHNDADGIETHGRWTDGRMGGDDHRNEVPGPVHGQPALAEESPLLALARS